MHNGISGSWLKHWDFMILDTLFIQVSYILAYMLRNGFENPYASELYLNIGVMLFFVGICAGFFLENYRGIMRRGYFQEFKAVLKYIFTICVFIMFYLFLSKNSSDYSRISFIAFVSGAVFIIYLERIFWKIYVRKHRSVNCNQTALLILTSADIAEQVITTVKKNSYNELRIVGIVLADQDDIVGKKVAGEYVVCTKQALFDYIRDKWIDGILVNVKDKSQIPQDLEEICLKMGVTVYHKLTEPENDIYNPKIEKFAGYVVMSSGISSASVGERFLKRLMDIVGSLVGIAITGILFLFIAPAIKILSPGPVIFSQVRIGKNGREFKMYKFRSMYMDAEEWKKELEARNQMQGNMFKLYDDPRIIGSGPDGKRHGLGWFLRKTSIDEFPQFWNVLKGDMSLVGTRPPTVDEWEKYQYHHRGRLAMKPGITGMWQVSGRSNITDFEEIVKMDIEYIQNWDIGQDIKILLKTFGVVLKGEGSG